MWPILMFPLDSIRESQDRQRLREENERAANMYHGHAGHTIRPDAYNPWNDKGPKESKGPAS
jgi:hypothetical protein